MRVILLQLMSVFILVACNKGGGGSSEPPPPPPPPPPVAPAPPTAATFTASLNLVLPLPGEILLDNEIAESDPSLNSALYQQSTLPEDKLAVGLINVVQSTQEQNPLSGSFNQTYSNSFEIKISEISEDEYTIVRTVRSVQTKSPMGGLLMAKAKPVEDTFYRDELYRVYNFRNAGQSVTVNPMLANSNQNLNLVANSTNPIQFQSCIPKQANDFQVHYYLGKYHTPLGGPEIPVYAIRRKQTSMLTCMTRNIEYFKFNLGSAQTNPPPPSAAATPVQSPTTSEIQYVSEEIYVYAPRALIIGNYSLDSTSAVPLYQSSSMQIVGGATLSKMAQQIQAPTF
jgi:hypothetical protein